jgi:F-type H+-transporting ATPase subunit a
MKIFRWVCSVFFFAVLLAAPSWASDESAPHATDSSVKGESSHSEASAGEHRGNAEEESNALFSEGQYYFKKTSDGSRDSIGADGKKIVDAGPLFNNLKNHATEDTYDLHLGWVHVPLPIMFFDDFGFHLFAGSEGVTRSGEYKGKSIEKWEGERSKSQFFWVAPWERVDGKPTGTTIDLSITGKRFFMLLVMVLLIIVVSISGSRAKRSLIPKGIQNLVESLMVYVRDEIVYQNVDKKWADKFMPFFLTVFLFILCMNLVGLLPLSMTPTNAISVTLALALCTFVLTQIAGFRAMGAAEYFKHFTGGLLEMELPLVMKVILICIMVPIEFIGLFTKPFALMIRLFANMTAGHIVIGSLIGLAILFQSVVAGFAVSVPFAIFIYLLELLVAFLQAYVFTMLSAVFIGMMAHEHEEHGEGHGEAAHAH